MEIVDIKEYHLDLFKDADICRLEAEIEDAKERTNRVRKGLFARFNRLQNSFDEMHADLEIFKRAICKGEYDGK